MAGRKSVSNKHLPKDRILYCERCGISFLWSGEEQQVATRPSEKNPGGGRGPTPTYCAGCRFLMPSSDRERGVVKWYNPRKRFGFIIRGDGTEIFAHGSRLRNARRLREEEFVEFKAIDTPQGTAAVEIVVLEESAAEVS